MILKRKFYERDSLTVAKELLGKILVHETKEGITSGKIVETEAYLGPEDQASHARNNLRTERTEAQFGPKGHAYIYQIYGMYFCFDEILAGEGQGHTGKKKKPGRPALVFRQPAGSLHKIRQPVQKKKCRQKIPEAC